MHSFLPIFESVGKAKVLCSAVGTVYEFHIRFFFLLQCELECGRLVAPKPCEIKSWP